MEPSLTCRFYQDENSRLLFDDPHANHYGSFGDQGAGTMQADPQEVQRETEALQKVVAQTSKYAYSVVDALEHLVQNPRSKVDPGANSCT